MILKRIFVLILFVSSFSGFAQNVLKMGFWRGALQLNDSTQLPFNFEVKYDLDIYSVVFSNAEELITANEIVVQGDSVFIKMPVFDSEFRCKNYGDSLKGVWINHARKDKNIIPFVAQIKPEGGMELNDMVFYISPLEGKWEVTFSPNSPESTKAIGLFKAGGKLDKRTKGTFLTETGDYRYLSGRWGGERVRKYTDFYFACFDGAHAFLFKGTVINKDSLVGDFYSGAHGHETWVAKRNDFFQLRNPDSLTYLKPGFTKVDFNFKNLEGKNVSLKDDKFKNKVVMIQIMGSWCPNCMDETKFLASFYDTYKSKGLEVVGLAFERTDNFAKAVSNVSRMKNKFNAKYEFLITGKTGAAQASEALPMLNAVMAFPTTIYIDKKGIVRKIYTGFYGPATGDNYTKYVEETTRFIEKLLAE